MPKVRWSLDNAPLETRLLRRGQEELDVADQRGPGPHMLVFFLASSDAYVDRWRTPVQSLKIMAIELEENGALLPPSGAAALEPRRVLFFGDSITEGMWVLGDSKDPHNAVPYDDATQAWPALLAAALEAEYGTCGFGGQSWNRPTGNVPPLPDSWSFFFQGRSRLIEGRLTPPPDYVFVNLGANDTADVTAAAGRWLSAIRSALSPATPVFVIIPFGQQRAEDLKAAVRKSGDPFVVILDLGPQWALGLNRYGTPSRASFDGLHPDATASGKFAAALARAVTLQLGRLSK